MARNDPTEYGGRAGGIQAESDGHSLIADNDGVGERARLARMWGRDIQAGMDDYIINATEPVRMEDGSIEYQVPVGVDPIFGNPERDALLKRTSGYGPESAGTEGV